MIVQSRDLVDVEVTHCDAGHPPDSPKGAIYLNTGAVWCKPAGGEWIRSYLRSAMSTAHIIRQTEAKDLVAALSGREITDEGAKTSSSGDGAKPTTESKSLQGHSSSNADEGSA